MAGPDESIFLSVIVPAYNEEARLGETLRKIRAHLESRVDACSKFDPEPGPAPLSPGRCITEIVVVDDGSTDATGRVAAEALRDRPYDRILRREENRGKGRSVREGVLASSGRFVLFSDADLSTPIEDWEKLFAEIRAGHDIAIGSRALSGSDIRRRQNPLREGMGKIFNILVRRLVMKGIPDTQCGFKLFKRKAARDIFSRLRTEGFGFDVEALYLARRLGYSIGQVPVVWANCPRSKVKILKSSAGMILDLLRIRSLHRDLKQHEKP